MAKKKLKKKAKQAYKPVSRRDYLLAVLKLTERSIRGTGDSVDLLFSSQAERIKKELEVL